MKKNWLIILIAAAVLMMAGAAQAGGDATAGKAKAASCGGCHGALKQEAGLRPEADFVAAMHAYKSGAKEHMMMKMMTQGLSDEDLANLAAYYGSLK